MARIAVLGTGLLGSGMVRRLLRKETQVTVWNRTEAKARALELEGARVAASPAAAAIDAERVHIVVQDDEVVDAILEKIAPALKKTSIVIDHSTTLPEGTIKRFARAKVLGLRFLHAPVFMSPQMAKDGAGLMIISGPKKEFDEVRPALEAMTGEAWYVGERPDLAALYKLSGNCMLFAISGGLADIIAMARANGVDPLDALSVFTKFQAGGIIQVRGPRMARNEVSPASFEIKMARKDVGLMMTAARDQPLVGLPCIARRMDDLIGAGHGDLDITAIGPAPK